MGLVDSQQARRILDRIVGYKLSPILWKKIKNGLSAGRVQSVALKLIIDREKEIQSFIETEYWTIEATHRKEKDFISKFYAFSENGKEKKINDYIDENLADEILKSSDKKNFKIEKIEKKKRNKHPFMPFTTSTLQQEASKRLGYSTSRTMKIAQSLYEGINIGEEGTVGLISYMRTDSTRLSSNIVAEAKSYIVKNFGKEYSNGGSTYSKVKKGSQDAHEAVRPSSIYRTPYSISKYLRDDEYKLYNLIWQRTLASQMAKACYDITTVTISSNKNLYKASGNIIIFDGFMKVWTSNEKDNELPLLKEGEILNTTSLEKIKHFTKPKARYNEASLVKALEENGIGRPSTYASIISSLISRNYVVIDNKQLVPTDIGFKVIDLLLKHFEDIVNEKFTANMEDRLDGVANEGVNYINLLNEFYGPFEKLLEDCKKDSSDYKVKDKVLDEKCPECGHLLVEKNGRHGKFIGCSNFPNCRFVKPLVKSTGVSCPKCGHDIIEKVSKKGKVFYGCSNYPSCDFALWNKPINEKCPKCQSLLTHVKNRYGEFIKCSNENCEFEKNLKKSN